jgi:hypothetical protein
MSVDQFIRAYATSINEQGGQNTATFRAHKLADTILEEDDILQLQERERLGQIGLFSVVQIRKEMAQLESTDGYFGAYKHRDNIEDMEFQMATQQLQKQAPCLLALLDALMIPRRVRQNQKERDPLSGRVVLITGYSNALLLSRTQHEQQSPAYYWPLPLLYGSQAACYLCSAWAWCLRKL